jgi:RNA recognition motif-containing protein
MFFLLGMAKVYLGGLKSSVTEEDLRNLLKEHGAVKEISIRLDYAFVVEFFD